MLLDRDDTIAAICTPPGRGGCAILRLSGPEAFSILATTVACLPPGTCADPPSTASAGSSTGGSSVPSGESTPEAKRRRVTPGRMTLSLQPTPDTHRPCVCPVFVYRMPAPRSYTREDVAEIHLPGSPPLLRAAMRALVEAGARVAQPGEFTLRAFLRGRIDLGQVESLGRLIAAETEAERREALVRLDRRLGNRIAAMRASLREGLAELEARIDFEEEESGTLPLAFADLLAHAQRTCTTLAAGADLEGRCAARVRFLGLTNAGKSALLNALLGREAALVSAQPTTTRDILRHDLRVGHVVLTLEDSPGLDLSETAIGACASAHAMASLASVSHAVLVVDGSTPPDARVRSLLDALPPSRIVLVRSKADVGATRTNPGDAAGATLPDPLAAWIRDAGHTHVSTVQTSVVTGEGMAALKAVLEAEALGGASGMLAAHCSVREAAELREAAGALDAACKAVAAGWGHELVAEDIRHAVEALHRAEGGGYADAVLDSIFSRFCIGK